MTGRPRRGERPSATSSNLRPSAITRSAANRAANSNTTRISSLRNPPSQSHHATIAARIDRTAAPSPAESMVSTATAATTTGSKRKEREFDVDHATGAAGGGSGWEETNINVVVRCRGRNEREVRENSAVVVSTDGVKADLVKLSMGPSALTNKTYNFDRVFSPAADQAMVYDDVVKPILEEMLSGYNCTIFAYGQTGTGKTYTMSGDMNDTFGLLADSAGIVPRVLHSLFKNLDAEETESFVKCSFIELYNEELRDLISPDDHAKLKIFDDTSRRGHATTVVQGMEESHIRNAAEGIKLLQDGSLKRQVASTECNHLSSRSHTVFTITACIKRMGEDGEDYVSAGKLNLVDLAGSENIQRSGAENKRAAEAGLINKSLLTLGRVINALVDRSSHIPYRESKLTRLLQDSLGGRTKTCIIATVSPAKSNLEETISTLDYAFRAKNIRNKPQVNQMINKKTLLKEFTHEIERLKSELIATRQRNGVYLSNESYEELTVESESRRIQTEEQAAKIESLENNLRGKVQELFSLMSSFMGLKKDHETTRSSLDEAKTVLDQTEVVLAATRKTLAEETYIREAHEHTEEQMHTLSSQLISTLQKTVSHVGGLHAKNKRKSDLQSLNRDTWTLARDQVADVTSLVESRVDEFARESQAAVSSNISRIRGFVEAELARLSETQAQLEENLGGFETAKSDLLDQKDRARRDMDGVLDEIKEVRNTIKTRVAESLGIIASAAEKIAQEVLGELDTFHAQLRTSYTGLGAEFRGIVDGLLAHVAEQKRESEGLRSQLSDAASEMRESNRKVAQRIGDVVREERECAAEERQELMLSISRLIEGQAESQEKRWAGRAEEVRRSVVRGVEEFGKGWEGWERDTEAWVRKGEDVVRDMEGWRDGVVEKVGEDWETANAHSTSIRNTTSQVHASTVHAVSGQLSDLDTQMASLDAFVTRARTANSTHHASHATALDALSSTVVSSYENIHDHFAHSFARIQDFDATSAEAARQAEQALDPLNENLCRPLQELREEIADTQLKEYQATGDTPQKMAYEFPTEMPRTKSHPKLVAELNGEGWASPCKKAVASGPQGLAYADPAPGADGEHDDEDDDDDDDEVGGHKEKQLARPHSADHNAGISRPAQSALNPFSMSLREVHPNVSGGGNAPAPVPAAPSFDSSTFMVDLESCGDDGIPVLKKARISKAGVGVSVATAAVKGKGKKVVNEGRENFPLSAVGAVGEGFKRSLGRRKSPRLP